MDPTTTAHLKSFRLIAAPLLAAMLSLTAGWSGDVSGTSDPPTVTVGEHTSITASFPSIPADSQKLKVRSENPRSGVPIDVSPADKDGKSDGTTEFTRQYDEDTLIELIAPETAPDGNAFERWRVSGGDVDNNNVSIDGNKLTLRIEDDLTVTAVYRTAYLLETTVTGEGTINRDPDRLSYDPDSTVELTAVPADGWQFDGWSGDASGSENPLTVTMDQAKSITAAFSRTIWTLSVRSRDAPSGVEVLVSPSDIDGNADGTTDFDRVYHDGTTVSLTAPSEANNGNPFTGWLVDGTPVDGNPIDVGMTADITATAVYLQTYKLSLSIDGQGSVVAVPDLDAYPEGSEVELAANPNSDWQFDGWTGDATGNANPLKITMDSDKNVTAVFTQIPVETYTLTIRSANPASGVAVDLSPDDNSGLGNGITEFTRTYNDGVSVSLTAPDSAPNGNAFLTWEVDGNPVAGNPIGVAMNQDRVVRAVYETRYTLATSVSGEGTVARDPNRSLFAPGEEVTLTASSSAGWRFGSWSGSASGSQNPLIISMDEDKSIIATFVQQCSLTVTVTGPGSVEPTAATRDCGDQVELTATPDDDAVFNGWSGDASGSDSPLTVVLDTDKEISASFSDAGADTYILTVGSSDPSSDVGVFVSPADNEGLSNGSTEFERTYDDGSTVTLTAPDEAPNGNSFTGWTVDGLRVSGNPIDVQMTEDRTAVAAYALRYALVTTIVGQGTISRDPDMSTYEPDSQVELTATPDTGWRFDGWSGDASGMTNPLTVTMDGNRDVTATFIERCSLTVFANGPGTVDPASRTVDCGTNVVITATPNGGARFNGWSGDASGSTNPLTVTVDDDLTITAGFSTAGAMTFDLTIASLTPESGATVFVSPTDNNGLTGGTTGFVRNYDEGATVMLTAAATANDNVFDEWLVDGSPVAGNPISVEMTMDRTATAVYSSRFRLTTSVQGQGTIVRDPNQSLFTANSRVTLTATPTTGYTFTGWSGDAVGSGNPLTVTMDADRSITATFIEIIQAPPSYEIERRQTFNGVEDSDAYRLIGLPGENTPSFASTFSGVPGEDWNAFWDNGSESTNSNDYLVPYSAGSSTFTFRPGRGFWALSRNPWNVDGVMVEQVDLNDENAYVVRLHAGWNIISSPFDIDVPWSAVAAASVITGDLYSYDGTWDAVDVLETYEGFYYYNRTGAPLDLVIPYTENAGKREAGAAKMAGTSVAVSSLTFTDSEGRTARIELGFADRAAEGVDDFDRFAPPGAFSSLDVVLGNPWSSTGLPKLRRDVRPEAVDGYTYEVLVHAAADVSAKYAGDGSGRSVVLLDRASGRAFDLTDGAARTVAPGRYLLIAGTSAFVSDQVGAGIEQPLVVQPAYPNPSSGRFTVDYTLRHSGAVEIAIVDMLGREIVRRDMGHLDRGLHEASFDLDANGRSPASGIYFVIVRADAGSRSQKIVVVR